MPRYTFPTIYDTQRRISLTTLISGGFIKEDQNIYCNYSWRRDGEVLGDIGLYIYMPPGGEHIQLKYNSNKEPIEYTVRLVSVPSNLGRGKVWYFLCPHTLKRCRYLHAVDKYFLHREVTQGMYEIQTYSHRGRLYNKALRGGSDDFYEEINRPYFKKYYRGKPTRRYKRLLNKLEKNQREAEALLPLLL